MKKYLKIIAEVGCIYGIVIFFYVAGVSYFQPYWLDKQVTHLQEGILWLSWLRNDILGIASFCVSIISYVWRRLLE